MQLCITIAKFVLILFVCYCVHTLISIFYSRRDKAAIYMKNVVDAALDNYNTGIFNRDKILGDLSKYGVMYMLKDYNMEASSWIIVKFIFAILFGVLGIAFKFPLMQTILAVIALAILGFFAPDIFIRISNSGDNSDMSNDILTIYTILKIHARAGVYITDSLIECQRSVANGRLKQALNEMNNNILSSKITMEEAIRQFNARFRNDQIDNLSIILLQATESGQSVSLLDDLSAQITVGNEIRTKAKKDKLKRELSIQQVAFFTLLTGMMLYLIVMEMFQSLQTL